MQKGREEAFLTFLRGRLSYRKSIIDLIFKDSFDLWTFEHLQIGGVIVVEE